MPLRRIVAGLLMASVFFVHLFGPVLAVEIEHSHLGDHDHQHHFAAGSTHDHHHDHDDHDGGKEQDPFDPDDPARQSGESDGTAPAKHSHHVVLEVDIPAPILEQGSIFLQGPLVRDPHLRDRARCPDGPSFDVIKPPQLG